MESMKSILTLTIFTVISLQIFSQQKFIEVNVADTVQATPDLFIYSIMPKDKNELLNDANAFDPKNYKNAEKEIAIKRIKLYDSLKSALQKTGFTILNQSLGNATMIDDDKTYAINIITSTTDSVILLYNHIKNLPLVTGFLLVSKAKNESQYYGTLYEKLINDATLKAKKLAELTKQQLGSIYSISENKEEKAGGLDGISAFVHVSF